MLGEIFEKCKNRIEQFAEKLGALDMEMRDVKSQTVWCIKFRIIQIVFVYQKKDTVTLPASTLYTIIFLNKNSYEYYHIPEIIDYIDENDFRCYYFPYIENGEKLDACMDILENFYLSNIDKINAIAIDDNIPDAIRDRKYKEIERICNIEMEEGKKELGDEYILHMIVTYERYVLLPRFTTKGPYRQFVRGNYDNALKSYNKYEEKNICTDYEKRIIKMLRSGQSDDIKSLENNIDSMGDASEYNGGLKDGLAYIKGFIICEVLFTAIFYLFYLILNTILNRENIVYVDVVNIGYFLIFASVPSIFGSLALRTKLAPLTRGKKAKKSREYDNIIIGKKTRILAMAAWIISLVMTLVIISFCTISTVRFYDSYMTFWTDGELIPKDFRKYDYAEIVNVYYIKGRYNDYGDYIDRPSYVIEFSDGYRYDFDGWVDNDVVKENILPIIENYYDQVIVTE